MGTFLLDGTILPYGARRLPFMIQAELVLLPTAAISPGS